MLSDLNEFASTLSPLHGVLSGIDPDDNILNSIFPSISDTDSSCLYSVSNFNNTFKNSTFSSFLHVNIRSLNANRDQFENLLDSLCISFDCFVLTETWLNIDTLNTANFEQYKSYHVTRQNTRGGGVSVYVSDKYDSIMVDELSMCTNTIEICAVGITNDIVVIGVYRPHGDTIDHFTNEIVAILNNPLLKNKKIVILGDFNINLFLTNNSYIDIFTSEMQSHGFYNVISKPTRFSVDDSNTPLFTRPYIYQYFTM